MSYRRHLTLIANDPIGLTIIAFFYFLFHDEMALEFIDGTYLLVS